MVVVPFRVPIFMPKRLNSACVFLLLNKSKQKRESSSRTASASLNLGSDHYQKNGEHRIQGLVPSHAL